jgi:hypothetical protein
MGFVKTLACAVVLWGKENAFDVISTVVMPEINEQSDCYSGFTTGVSGLPEYLPRILIIS